MLTSDHTRAIIKENTNKSNKHFNNTDEVIKSISRNCIGKSANLCSETCNIPKNYKEDSYSNEWRRCSYCKKAQTWSCSNDNCIKLLTNHELLCSSNKPITKLSKSKKK